MNRRYLRLLREYPEVVSKEQMCKICHISKRKATWLLEHGYIPCEDSGKKTRRFKIKTRDIIKYLEHQEEMPVGIFSSHCESNKMHSPISEINAEELSRYLQRLWSNAPNTMNIDEVADLTGYNKPRIRKWAYSGKLKALKWMNHYVVPKEWLIEFIANQTVSNPWRLSEVNRKIAEELL